MLSRTIVRRAAATLAVAAAGTLSAASPALAYRFVTAWGGEGAGAGQFGSGREAVGGDRQFDDPGGLALDGHGALYVSDPSNNRIEKFSVGGAYLGKFGSYGFARSKFNAKGKLILPEGLAVDGSGNVYVADNRNDRVEKFNRHGRYSTILGERGAFSGQLVSPWGVTLGPGGLVYVVDQGNYRISRFTRGGRARRSFGGFGTGPGGLQAPNGIVTARNGTLLLTDQRKDQVLRFSSSGALLGAFGGRGTGPGQFTNAMGIAVDGAGYIYVVDNFNPSPPRFNNPIGGRVERFTPDGRFVGSFGGTPGAVTGGGTKRASSTIPANLLRSPTFVAVDGAGNVYVSDFRRVVKYAP